MGKKNACEFWNSLSFQLQRSNKDIWPFFFFFAVCLNVWKLMLISPQEAEKVQYVLVSIVTSIWQGVGIDS